MLAIDELLSSLTNNIKQHKFNIKDILNLEKGIKKTNNNRETINKIYFKNKYDITIDDTNIVTVFSRTKEPFIESLLNIMFIGFYKLLETEKLNKIIEFKRKLGFSLNEYIKTNIHEYFLKKYKRLDIQKQILSENNKINNYTKPTNELLNYIADYFDINIYIFEISENNTIDNIIAALSKKKIIDWKKPTIFINREIKTNKYIALIDRENKYIINQKYEKILEKLYDIIIEDNYKNILNNEEIEYEYNEEEDNDINEENINKNENKNELNENELNENEINENVDENEINENDDKNELNENEDENEINENEDELNQDELNKNEEKNENKNEEKNELNEDLNKEDKKIEKDILQKKLNNMKLIELVEECKKYNISELKESEKTKKMIKKIKNELINELFNIME